MDLVGVVLVVLVPAAAAAALALAEPYSSARGLLLQQAMLLFRLTR